MLSSTATQESWSQAHSILLTSLSNRYAIGQGEIVSEIQEFLDELRERYQNWRERMKARNAPPHIERIPDIPGVEFTPLDPTSSPTPPPPRTFADIRLAWLASLCPPDLLVQGEQYLRTRRVTRVHALGNRMTGTVQDQRYEDQEVLLQEGTLVAICTCEQLQRNGVAPAARPDSRSALPLRCRHVVAILLAYIHQQNQQNQQLEQREGEPSPFSTLHGGIPTPPPIVNEVTCPVTRQTLAPGQPYYQCRQCGISYSVDGWEFLRKADKGRCCGCEARRTVHLIRPPSAGSKSIP